MKTAKKTSRKTTKSTKATKTAKAPKAPKVERNRDYTGAPIPATKLYLRKMPEFKNTTAECLLGIDEASNTYWFANTYRGGCLPASYDVSNYRYELTDKAQKKLNKKIEDQGFQELERTDWPSYVVPATAAKKKAAKK